MVARRHRSAARGDLCRIRMADAPLRVATRAVVIAKSLAGMEADLVRPLSLGRRLAVVSDPDDPRDPRRAGRAGADGPRPRSPASCCRSIRIPTTRPSSACARPPARPMRWSPSAPAPSTTSASMPAPSDRKPYVVFGTAPSMNGYTSVNAAITVHGHKKSLAGAGAGRRVPRSVDPGGRAGADDPLRARRQPVPRRRRRPTGCCRTCCSTCPIAPCPSCCWRRTKPQLFASAEALVNGDLDAMERLVRTLLLSGFGTAICGNSLPASQGEHLISHYGDMLPRCRPALHRSTASRSA